MIVIYHCYGGTHSSVLAAAVHIGLLDPQRPPTPSEITRLPYFDSRDWDDYGRLCEYGRDKQGNRVFILGRGWHAEAPECLFRQMQRIRGGSQRYKLVNSARTLNWQMKLGGYLSRRLHMKRLGLPLVVHGTRKTFPRIAALVESIHKEV